jgi:hypothetical protein
MGNAWDEMGDDIHPLEKSTLVKLHNLDVNYVKR